MCQAHLACMLAGPITGAPGPYVPITAATDDRAHGQGLGASSRSAVLDLALACALASSPICLDGHHGSRSVQHVC